MLAYSAMCSFFLLRILHILDFSLIDIALVVVVFLSLFSLFPFFFPFLFVDLSLFSSFLFLFPVFSFLFSYSLTLFIFMCLLVKYLSVLPCCAATPLRFSHDVC